MTVWFALDLVSWCFEPSQPQRVISGLCFALDWVEKRIGGGSKYHVSYCVPLPRPHLGKSREAKVGRE